MRALLTLVSLVATGCAVERPIQCTQTHYASGPFASCAADGRTKLGYEHETYVEVTGYWLPVCDETWSGRCGETSYDPDLDLYVAEAQGGTSTESGASGVRPLCESPFGEPQCAEGTPRCVFIPCDGEWHYGAAH